MMISFRGTQGLSDGTQGLSDIVTDVVAATGLGFSSYSIKFKSLVEKAVAYAGSHGMKVVFTGHSLGGAAAEIWQNDIVGSNAVTFGSPGQPGNTGLSIDKNVFNFANSNDWVANKVTLDGRGQDVTIDMPAVMPELGPYGKTPTPGLGGTGPGGALEEHSMLGYGENIGALTSSDNFDVWLANPARFRVFIGDTINFNPVGDWVRSNARVTNDDRIVAYGQDAYVLGLKGNDQIYGGPGNDILDGGAGNDTINGGDGNDIISGGDGNDTLIAGKGVDAVDGGAGGYDLAIIDYSYASTIAKKVVRAGDTTVFKQFVVSSDAGVDKESFVFTFSDGTSERYDRVETFRFSDREISWQEIFDSLSLKPAGTGTATTSPGSTGNSTGGTTPDSSAPVGDISGAISTSAKAYVGQSFVSALEFANDKDWVKINLTSGVKYHIDIHGQSVASYGTAADVFFRV
jgi:Ca2+-binding RTX toxin-like protein